MKRALMKRDVKLISQVRYYIKQRLQNLLDNGLIIALQFKPVTYLNLDFKLTM